MSEKDERLGITLAFEPGYLRPTPIRDTRTSQGIQCIAVGCAEDREIDALCKKDAVEAYTKEYVGYVVDKEIDALCKEAAKEVREGLIEFVMESVRKTNPSAHADLEARRKQNFHDALTLAMPKLLLKEHLRARFQYFDTKWGSIQYIYQGRPDLDPPGVGKG